MWIVERTRAGIGTVHVHRLEAGHYQVSTIVTLAGVDARPTNLDAQCQALKVCYDNNAERLNVTRLATKHVSEARSAKCRPKYSTKLKLSIMQANETMTKGQSAYPLPATVNVG